VLDPTNAEREQEELAKAWILDVVNRTPLTELPYIRVAWLAREAAPLIADVFRGLNDPGADFEQLGGAAAERAGELASLRRGESGPTTVPRDLAALQALVIEALGRSVPEREPGDFEQATRRLAEVFGGIQARVIETIVRERSGGAQRDELTGLPGEAELNEWLGVLIAEYRRYGHPFATMLIDIEGLGQINEAYGPEAGNRMLAAMANVVSNQVRGADRAFRLGGGEFCVLTPHHDADRIRPLADRLIGVVEASQGDGGPRLGISIGVASCPDHAETAERLLEAAEEATFAAKADGKHVVLAGSG
jgi:diguanylate cyclase (GGDEF)-like protein